jgi:cytochrome c oxidase cbb3-type subunit III
MKSLVFYIFTGAFLISMGAVQVVASESNKNGAKIYRQYCIACHGSEGQGDGDRAKNEQLDPRPRVHSNGDYMNMIPSMRFFRVIKFGGKSIGFSHVMPQWQHILSDDDIIDVIGHIRSLAKPAFEENMVRGCQIPVPVEERSPIKQR